MSHPLRNASRIILLCSFMILPLHVQAEEPFSPKEAATKFEVAEGLRWEQVLAEPHVSQPVFLNFDEKGRLWTVEYLQYPYPAGLKVLSRDKHWRTVFDRVPPPPPNHFRGKDRISIHEDTNGDGTYDSHKVFLEGLNIVTSCVKGRGGVWVLNPPYLLFYPDANNDDVPDSDPVVHLSGFGLQDTHSVTNSLRWGPGGWLYASHGSTVTANVIRPGIDKQGRFMMGQHIWRYHPETKRYEVFAEGGGNAFGVEFDVKGRVYSGHNGGNTRGFHYVQGGYYQKGFTKHGPLSNPYTFGYFSWIKHPPVKRFTHNFVIYEAEELPEEYRGRLYGIEPLQGRIVRTEMKPLGSTWETKDIDHPVTSSDNRFRPVDIKVGPDGGIYVADFYEKEISHREHYSGNIEKTTGRVYRLLGREAKPLKPFDLGKLSSQELLTKLEHENKWFRQTALRLLGDRRDKTIVPGLLKKLEEQKGDQLSLESLWALHLSGGLTEQTAAKLLHHPSPFVRLWTVRLMGDANTISDALASQFAELAQEEQHVQVRSQLACTARRLKVQHSLPILHALLQHVDDVNDPHLPLLCWWVIEHHVETGSDDLTRFFNDSELWQLPTVQKHLLSRLMRRLAVSGKRQHLLQCAKLLNLSPDEISTKELMKGFEEAFEGRSLSGIPEELVTALTKAGGGSVSLRIRQNDQAAITQALKEISDAKVPLKTRMQHVRTFGEVSVEKALSVLLKQLQTEKDAALQQAILTALLIYNDDAVAKTVLKSFSKWSVETQDVAQMLLASRVNWSTALLNALDEGKVKKESLSLEHIRKITVFGRRSLHELIEKHFGKIEGASNAEMQASVKRLLPVIQEGKGDSLEGRKLFEKSCAKCHTLYGRGGYIGPDLTPYKRDDSRNMLINIVNPSAEIREGFETFTVVTFDGRALSGFVIDRDKQVLSLKGSEGQTITIQTDEIDEMLPQKKSLMPEGLLKSLTDQQVRDLFAYLRSSQPLNY